jgi:hypothetical protein
MFFFRETCPDANDSLSRLSAVSAEGPSLKALTLMGATVGTTAEEVVGLLKGAIGGLVLSAAGVVLSDNCKG